MRVPRSLSAFVLVVSTLAASAGAATAGEAGAPPAERLVLKDGRVLDGEVLAETAEGVTFRAGGTARFYAKDAIERREALAAPATTAPETSPPPGAPTSSDSAAPASAPTSASDAPPAAGKPAKPSKDEFGKRGKVLTDASRAFVAELAAKAAQTDDEQVRRSIAAALEALGPASVPAIRDAAAAAPPDARQFLTRVADRLAERLPRKGEGLPKDGGAPDDGMTSGDPAPGAPPDAGPKGPGGKGQGEKGQGERGRGMFDKLARDLELRDDQRPAFAAVLMKMERSRGQIARDVEGGLPVADAESRIAAVRSEVLDGARGVLDAGQMAMFEEIAARHFEEMSLRIARTGSKKQPKPTEPAPGPSGDAPKQPE